MSLIHRDTVVHPTSRPACPPECHTLILGATITPGPRDVLFPCYPESGENWNLFSLLLKHTWGFPGGSVVKNLPANTRDSGSIPSLGRWRREWQPTPIFLPGESPWKEETGGLQSIGLERVRHDLSDLEHLQGWLHNSQTQLNWKCRPPCSKDWGKMSLKIINRKVFLPVIVSLSTCHGVFNLLFNVVQSNKKLKY